MFGEVKKKLVLAKKDPVWRAESKTFAATSRSLTCNYFHLFAHRDASEIQTNPQKDNTETRVLSLTNLFKWAPLILRPAIEFGDHPPYLTLPPPAGPGLALGPWRLWGLKALFVCHMVCLSNYHVVSQIGLKVHSESVLRGLKRS